MLNSGQKGEKIELTTYIRFKMNFDGNHRVFHVQEFTDTKLKKKCFINLDRILIQRKKYSVQCLSCFFFFLEYYATLKICVSVYSRHSRFIVRAYCCV